MKDNFSPEYIGLCQAAPLRPPGGWDYGDWHMTRWKTEAGWSEWAGPDMCNDDGGGFPPDGNPEFQVVWLPRLDQLLDLLGGNAEPITLLSLRRKGWVCQIDIGIDDRIGAKGANPEEAVLQCYLAKRGALLALREAGKT